jgi:hypothetical protein
MSLRIDTSEWIAGSLLIGDTGLGVLGSAIPSTGGSGAGYAYNDLSLPADSTKEICGQITTWPSAGTLTAYEDTSFDFSGAPDGTYTFTYQLYVDGVATGSPATVTLSVGTISGNASGTPASITLSAPTATATGEGSFSGSISDADIDRIVASVLAALNATTIPVDMQKTNGAEIIGDGSEANPWRGVGVVP